MTVALHADGFFVDVKFHDLRAWVMMRMMVAVLFL
jgi:hypothetical protein